MASSSPRSSFRTVTPSPPPPPPPPSPPPSPPPPSPPPPPPPSPPPPSPPPLPATSSSKIVNCHTVLHLRMEADTSFRSFPRLVSFNVLLNFIVFRRFIINSFSGVTLDTMSRTAPNPSEPDNRGGMRRAWRNGRDGCNRCNRRRRRGPAKTDVTVVTDVT